MSYGTVSHFDDGATVRFDRTINASIEQVWTALTSANDLAAWLAPTRLDTNVGGAVHIDFGDDQKVDGEVTECAPCHVLEYTWTFTGEPDSILRFELEAIDSWTRLVLVHRLLPPDQAAGYGAGWHAHLDSLVAVIAGTGPIDWDARFSEVLGTYVGE